MLMVVHQLVMLVVVLELVILIFHKELQYLLVVEIQTQQDIQYQFGILVYLVL